MYRLKDVISGKIDFNELAKIISIGNLSVQEYRTAVAAFLYASDYESAEFTISRAIEEKYNIELSLINGDILLAQGKLEEANQFWDSIATKDVNELLSIQARKIFCLLYNGMTSEAEKLLKLNNENNFDILACKAILLLKKGQIFEFMQSIKAIQYSPNIICDYILTTKFLLSDTIFSDIEKTEEYFYALKIWIPSQPTNSLFNIYESLTSGKKMLKSTFKSLNNELPIVYLIASNQAKDSVEQIKYLQQGLQIFKSNVLLLEKHCEISPADPWFFSHMRANNIDVPPEITIALNSEKNHQFSSDYLNAFKSDIKDLSVTTLGGSKNIGASAYVITFKGKSILLDCGLNPNKDGVDSYPLLDKWNGNVDAIIISHGHLDHCGAIPKAHAIWKNALIYSTAATKAFAELLFRNMLKFSKMDYEREILNDTIEEDEMVSALNSFVTLEYLQWKEIFPNCKIRFHHAGHILGASIVEINWVGAKIVFTGDFCLHNQKMLKGANLINLPKNPDLLITESTYALKRDNSVWEKQLGSLMDAVNKVIKKNGIALLPSFALGRSQELVYAIGEAYAKGYLDQDTKLIISGMACEACKIAEQQTDDKKYKEYFKYFSRLPKDVSPPEKSIIIASSGMMAKGSASYNIAQDIKYRSHSLSSGIFFCGYMDEETERENSQVHGDRLKQNRYPLAAHSTSFDIENFIQSIMPKAIIFVHWGNNICEEQHTFTSRIRDDLAGNCMTFILNDNTKSYPCNIDKWLIER